MMPFGCDIEVLDFSDVSVIYMMIGIPLISGPLLTTSAVGNLAQISGHGGVGNLFKSTAFIVIKQRNLKAS
jgi:hypothetical protein